MLLTLRHPISKLLYGGKPLPQESHARVDDTKYARIRVGDTYEGAVVVKIEKER